MLKFIISGKRMHSTIIIYWQQWDAYLELAQDVDGHGTTCSLLFVRQPWIEDVYEHELFITQPQQVKTYELLFNGLWQKKNNSR